MISHDFSVFPEANSFHQDNYSFQFYADNNSRCSFQFCFVLFGIFLQLIISLQLFNHGTELITQPSNYEKISWL